MEKNAIKDRAMGAVMGTLVGLKGIPDRFISGLTDHDRLLRLAEKIAGGLGRFPNSTVNRGIPDL